MYRIYFLNINILFRFYLLIHMIVHKVAVCAHMALVIKEDFHRHTHSTK
jgi:hypothetical protein